MARRFPAPLTVFLLAGFLVSGCAGEALTWNPETAAERTLREKAEALQATVGEGALTGAALGGAVGLLGGAGGAALGARIGQTLGAGAGNYVKFLQANYADRESLLDKIAADIGETNAELDSVIVTMRAVLAEQTADLERLRTEIAAGEAEVGALEAENARAEANLEEMRRAVEGAERKQQVFVETRAVLSEGEGPEQESVERLDPEIASLARRIRAMRDIAETLAAEV